MYGPAVRRKRFWRSGGCAVLATASVVGAIAPMVEQAEIERARLKPTENLDAYDFLLRGMAKAHDCPSPAMQGASQLQGTAGSSGLRPMC
jgi:hypothetical protein